MKNHDSKGRGADQPLPKRNRAEEPRPQAADNPRKRAHLMKKARLLVEQTPEVRPERVASLQEAVRQGTYRINSRKLANILIAKLMSEE